MNIVISGSSGLLGRELTARWEAESHRVIRLIRPGSSAELGPDRAAWNPASGELDPAVFAEAGAVVHLGGENIASGIWTAARKKRLLESRTKSTGLIARKLAGLDDPPPVFLCASAVGFYGLDRGDELLVESAGRGEGFLGDLAERWEAACQPAVEAGIRVVNMRLGVVLSKKGGALAKMITPFRLGLGGRLGSGRQYMSWIAIVDAVAAMAFCLQDERMRGPVNLVSPEPVTNAAFTKALARVLRRPAFLPVPAFALKLMLGEMARELFLASTRAVPRVLTEAGFEFAYPDLDAALSHELA